MIKKFDPIRALTLSEEYSKRAESEAVQKVNGQECKKEEHPWYLRLLLKFAINIVRLLIALLALSFLLHVAGNT